MSHTRHLSFAVAVGAMLLATASAQSSAAPLTLRDAASVALDPNNSIGAPFNAMHFRVKFLQQGAYNYKCALHDNLGMVGQVLVLPKTRSLAFALPRFR